MKQNALILVATAWCLLVTPASIAARQIAGTTTGPNEAVFLIDVVDVSGTVSRRIVDMTNAEIGQLRRTLRVGDLYARVAFDGSARVTALQRISEAADIERLVRVLAQPEAKGAKTSISTGLVEARQLAEREAGGHRVVMVLATDGLSDPPDGDAAEAARMIEATTWWRNRPDTVRILVGVQAPSNAAHLRRLVEHIGATLVTIETYSTQSFVERAIADARASELAVSNPPRSRSPFRLSAGLAMGGIMLITALLITLALRKRVRARVSQRPSAVAAPVFSGAVAQELIAVVSSHGHVKRTVLPLSAVIASQAPDSEIATIGTGGTVFVQELAGRPVRVCATVSGLRIYADVPGIRVNGEPVAASGHTDASGHQVQISHGAVAITLQLQNVNRRTTAAADVRPRIKVTTKRRIS